MPSLQKSSLQKFEPFLEYQRLSLGELREMPAMECKANKNSKFLLYKGEIFCRVAGCTSDTIFARFTNLKTHIRNKHVDVYNNLVGKENHGRPKSEMTDQAKAFYQSVIDARNARLEAQKAEKLELPLAFIEGTTIVDRARMERVLIKRFPDRKIPCVSCELSEEENACGTLARLVECDHFAEFDLTPLEGTDKSASESDVH